MSREEIKQQIRDNVRWESKRPPTTGGQQCGMPVYPVILICDELDLEITVGHYRSQLQNREFAVKLLETALDELVK